VLGTDLKANRAESQSLMKLVAIIPTVDRRTQVNPLLRYIELQHWVPDEVIDSTHVEPTQRTPRCHTFLAKKGCARNVVSRSSG
jgi:hypothetical protein